MGERKLVEAFRTFFDRSVAPHLSGNEEVMRQWNHLNKIIGSEPIDYSQIDFYLLLANKGKGSQNSISSFGKIPDADPSARFRQSDFNMMRMNNNAMDKKGSMLGSSNNKKKNLVNNLQSLQKLLTSNQEKLEGMSRQNMGSSSHQNQNGTHLRRY